MNRRCRRHFWSDPPYGRDRWIGRQGVADVGDSLGGGCRTRPSDQYASAEITSPPPTVPTARQVRQLIEDLIEVHAAVSEEGIDPPGMVAPGRDGRIGRAAVVLVLGAHVAVEGRQPGRRPGIGGQGGGEAIVERIAVTPMGVAAARHARGGRGELASRRRGRRDAREHGRNIGVRIWARRSGRRHRAAVMVGRRIRLDLAIQQRIAQPIRERRKRAAQVGADRAGGRHGTGESAEGVPGPLAPAIVRDAIRRGHAGAVRAGERLPIGLARAEEDLQLRGDGRRIRRVARLVRVVDRVVDRAQLQERDDARRRAPARLPGNRAGGIEREDHLGRQHAIGTLVVVHPETELLEIVDALNAASGLACRLHGRQRAARSTPR